MTDIDYQMVAADLQQQIAQQQATHSADIAIARTTLQKQVQTLQAEVDRLHAIIQEKERDSTSD